jgi:hypothetical protein
VWQVGLPKSKASKGPVPLHPLLADFMRLWKQKTTYSQAGDWVFPSTRLNGKQPRVANMLVEDHLRPAAVNAGILLSHADNHGGLVDDDPRRFGFHNLRHSLASFLIRIRTDPKTVQTLLRHSDVKLRLERVLHSHPSWESIHPFFETGLVWLRWRCPFVEKVLRVLPLPPCLDRCHCSRKKDVSGKSCKIRGGVRELWL